MKEIELKLHIWPDKILREKCRQVEEVNLYIRGLLDKMFFLMKKNKGIGLSANQAGLDLSLVVIDLSPLGVDKNVIFKLVNPKILKKEGVVEFTEGCLSFPDLTLTVKRAKKVWVDTLNEKGEHLTLEARGILSIVLQHEIDHINGILFIDRIPFWQRIGLSPKLKEIAKRN